MKRFALIAAVVFTTITLNSCRQSDDILSPEETATLRRAQDSSNHSRNSTTPTINTEQDNNTPSNADGEIVPPPRK